MKYQKKYFLICLFILFHLSIFGQMSEYSFTSAINTSYSTVSVNATGACYPGQSYDLRQPAGSPDQLKYIYTNCQGSKAAVSSGPGFPIGFDFIYDGQRFDRFAISANGYIKLGRSGEDIVMYNDTTEGGVFKDGNNSLRSNVISVHQKDAAIFPSSFASSVNWTISYETNGLPGQRKLGISWSACLYIYLYENSNKIEMVYRGPLTYNGNPLKLAIGLRGKEENNNINNLNTRTITSGINNWAASIKGTTATDLCDFSTSFQPSDYLTYTWTPPVVSVPPVCPFIYLTYYTYGNTVYDSIPSGYIYGYHDNGSGATGNGNIYFKLADGTTNVPRNPVLYWSPAPYLPTTYDVYFGTDNPPVTLVSQNQTETHYITEAPYLAPNSNYYYKIVPKNAYGKGPACTGNFTTGSIMEYCYRVPGGSYTSNITFNTIAYNSASSPYIGRRIPEISPYTTTIQRNETYTLSLTAKNPLPPGSGFTKCAVYIDWNQDGDFDDVDEVFSVGNINAGATQTKNISVPNTATLGKTVMRIRTAEQNMGVINPCNPYSTAIDFVLTIAPTTACSGFTLNPITNNVHCFGESNGSIDLNASGGTKPYIVTWTDEGSTNEQRTGLSRNIYKASVTDASGCEISTPLIPILQPGMLNIDTITASDNSTDLFVSGGTIPYTYLWSNGDTYSDPDDLEPGVYSLTVNDANGCEKTMNDILIRTITGISVADREEGLLVYPNPTSGIMYLRSKTQKTMHVEIVNGQGAVMKEGDYISNSENIDISSLPSGLYFVKIKSDKSLSAVKVVKK